jgi:hypothetical protein
MKKNGKMVFKKGTKNEAEQYFEFLRDGLYRELKYIPFSTGEDNIEDVKIVLRDSILKYAFLEDIIREICPKILEPIDEDIQQEMEEIQAQSKLKDNMTDLIYVIKQ